MDRGSHLRVWGIIAADTEKRQDVFVIERAPNLDLTIASLEGKLVSISSKCLIIQMQVNYLGIFDGLVFARSS